MIYIKKFESLDIEKSRYKEGNIVKIIDTDTDDIGMIDYCGYINDKYIYTIKTIQGSRMRFYYDDDLQLASKDEINLFLAANAAKKYNL